MERERGTETSPCPTCSTALAVVELADGAKSTVLCVKCYGPKVEKAAEAPVAREYGTEVKEDD